MYVILFVLIAMREICKWKCYLCICLNENDWFMLLPLMPELTMLLLILLATLPKGTYGLLCYSCTDLKNNEICFNVTQCPDAEACYGRADGFLTGNVKHTTGCTKELVVPKLSGSNGYSFCAKTCRENLCNLHECQLENTTRPPRCLSCDFVDHPDDCKNVTECHSGEVCFVERMVTFNRIKYRLGCVRDQDCNVQPLNSMAILGKRSSTNHCSVCCKSDHCNLNACDNATGQTFQLKSLSTGAACVDPDPKICETLGRFNADACSDPYVVTTCPKSCMTCVNGGWCFGDPRCFSCCRCPVPQYGGEDCS